MSDTVKVAVITTLGGILVAVITGLFALSKRDKNTRETTPSLKSTEDSDGNRQLARSAVSQTMAMLFVDLMRLLYVMSSDAARVANAKRHSEFVAFATLHLRNLESHLARFSKSLGGNFEEQSLSLERQLSHIVNEFTPQRDLTSHGSEYFVKMRKVGAELHQFCRRAMGESYEATFNRVGARIDHLLANASTQISLETLDEVWSLRLDTQDALLDTGRQLEESELYTIADDMTHQEAITYFILDYKILRVLVAA